MAEFVHKGEWVEVPEEVARLIRLAALTEARDAVEALIPRFTQTNGWLMGQEIGAALDAALVAIDALKEKP